MNYPRVKFKIDFRKDLKTLRAFVNDAKYDRGRSLKWGIFRRHPYLRSLLQNQKRIPIKEVKKYIIRIYSKHDNTIKHNLVRYRKEWSVKESKFFELTNDIFNGYRWPKGKYIAYLTIWSMYPRFLEDKTFQIPIKHQKKGYINVIIAHEMLHFIFYEYFYKLYPRYRQSRYNHFVWHISEIFNVLIQNSPVWFKVFKTKTMLYPEHKKIIARLRKKMSAQNLSASNLIVMIIKEVKKEMRLR
ncbi:MAG: hypothetical protein QME25_09425 [Bacteroidota bacterium]|nr:hypothetical protein [Bacteroidota bacterium]